MLQAASKPEVIDLSPESEKKLSRPQTYKQSSTPQVPKRQLNNANLFEDSEDESDLSEPLSKRLKVTQARSEVQLPTYLDLTAVCGPIKLGTGYVSQAAHSCSPEVEAQVELRPHRVFAQATTAAQGDALLVPDAGASLTACVVVNAAITQQPACWLTCLLRSASHSFAGWLAGYKLRMGCSSLQPGQGFAHSFLVSWPWLLVQHS